MSRFLVLALYNVLLPFALLLMLPGYLLKMLRRGNYGSGFGERFAMYRADKRREIDALDRPVWVHAVSVGEVNIAKKLIAALRVAEPDIPIVISTTTPTGFAIARESEASVAIYNPVDFWPIARRALGVISPRAIVLVEAEVWPNIVSIARRRGLEVSLVNARLSPRSERRYRKFKALVAPVFRMLTRVCVQEEEDIERWVGLGVSRDKILHAGSIKFDLEESADPESVTAFRELLSEHLAGRQRTILLAGSTHPGEEALIGKVYLQLRERFPQLYYLVAPRHVERREELLAEMRAQGLSPALRTEIGGGGDDVDSDCLVIDTTGELGAWYHLADLVVVGKSFLAEGGQNPVEAITAGKPVFYGPHMENFAALERMMRESEGAVQVEDERQLFEEVERALGDPEGASAMVDRAKSAMASHRGSARRTAEAILACKSPGTR